MFFSLRFSIALSPPFLLVSVLCLNNILICSNKGKALSLDFSSIFRKAKSAIFLGAWLPYYKSIGMLMVKKKMDIIKQLCSVRLVGGHSDGSCSVISDLLVLQSTTHNCLKNQIHLQLQYSHL